MRIVHADLGADAVLELDQELIISLNCTTCQTRERVLKPMAEVTFQAAHCSTCGSLREIEMTHSVTGKEDFLSMTLAEAGVPALHILRAYNAQEYRFYELSGDLKEALHFSHFEKPSLLGEQHGMKVRLGAETPAETPAAAAAPMNSGPRITLKE